MATRHPARRRHALQRPGSPVHQSDPGQVASQCSAPANSPGADRGKIPRAVALHAGEAGRGLVQAHLNDAAWKPGEAPFGTEEPPFARKPNTVWTSADIWLRREFEMPAGKFTDLALLLHHDEDTEVYINGVLAVQASGFNAAYESCDITPKAKAALKPGKNFMAAHCRQTTSGQYIDLGLEASVPK